MSVACGNKIHQKAIAKVHHHDSVAQVRLCFSRPTGVESAEEQEYLSGRGYADLSQYETYEATVSKAEPVTSPPALALPADWRDGLYTFETSGGHRTFRFRTQESTSSFKPGVQIVSYLTGQNNSFASGDYTQFGEVTSNGTTKIWAKHRGNPSLFNTYLAFLADPGAAKMSAFCKRCHAELTVPESIEAGFGPTCIKMGIR